MMSARSRASSRSAERGVAVIMAMLTVAIVAALAAGIISAFGFAVENISGRRDLAQARWMARGAIDWSRDVLADDKRRTAFDHLGEQWATKVPPMQVEEGEVSGEIEDLCGKLNLNNLIMTGTPDATTQAAFKKLLTQLGVSTGQADILTQRLTLWINADKQEPSAYGGSSGSTLNPPNAPLLAVDELLNIPGFDAALVERLRPFVTAVPPGNPLNLDTTSAEVMSAYIPEMTLDQARIVISQRNIAVFQNQGDFIKVLNTISSGRDWTISWVHLGFTTHYFLASGRAKYGSATTRMQVLLERADTSPWPAIRWQKIL